MKYPHAIRMLSYEAAHQRRSAREHARRAASTTDATMRDDWQDRAAQCLQAARECEEVVRLANTTDHRPPTAGREGVR